jgi:hypothetical protein
MPHLGSALLVLVGVRHAVDLEAVRLQGAPLSKGLLAEVALVRADTWRRKILA